MILLSAIFLPVIIIDQLLKWVMLNMLIYGDPVPVIQKYFSLTLVFNKGAAFGILQGKKYFFLILPVVTIIILLFIYLSSKDKKEFIMPFGLLIGGTVGNFIDRLKYGYVIDFFDFYIKEWHWPAFNIADSCICIGVFLLFMKMFKFKS
jgi:signal peptidase II